MDGHNDTKKIHQIWLQGEVNLPPNYKKYSEAYQALNKDWKYKLWDEKKIRALIVREYPHLLCIYDNYTFWVMRVDLGKYCILDSEGGLVVDMDIKPKKPLTPIMEGAHGKPAVIFYPHRKGGKSNFHFLEKMVHRITNNNFIYSPYPHHPFTELLLERALCTSERMPWDFKLYYIVGSIGPLFLIDTIEKYGPDCIHWIDEKEADEYISDERANSWNKKYYDNHDIFWGIFFIIMIIIAIYIGYATTKFKEWYLC